MAAGTVMQGSWIIGSSKQICLRMARMSKQNLCSTAPQTDDFSSMYPSMHLNCVRKKLTDYVALVFEQAKQNEHPYHVSK